MIRKYKAQKADGSGKWIEGRYANNGNGQHYFVAPVVNSNFYTFTFIDVIPETICESVGIKDIHGKDIYADSDIVRFKFLHSTNELIELIGCFTFNNIDLSYGIDIYSPEHPEYVCLSYSSYVLFKDFEIIGTKQENPELIKL